MSTARRILAFDHDTAFLERAGGLLTKAGLQVCAVNELSAVLAQMASFKPNLVLLDRGSPGTATGEVTMLLRNSSVPLVFLLANSSGRELIRALQVHAVEVMHRPFGEEHVARILALLDELSQRPHIETVTWEDQVARNLVDLARRHKLTGTLMVNRGTPFEGRVVFREGALQRAAYGPLSGMEAVREILQLEEGLFELDESLNVPGPRVARSATQLDDSQAIQLSAADTADIRPRLLAVDDEPDMLTLMSKHLARAGFEVFTATDGIDAVEQALQLPFDIIVADLNMPRMDGWEMLKTLKSNHRTREVPVVFISAHDDYRESLRAARAGAHDYLSKTGHSEQVVNASLKAITPRLEALFHLLVKEPVPVRIQTVGLQWFLRALARLESTGVLSLQDDYGRYQMVVREGLPVAALSEVQQRKVGGIPGFARTLVASTAHGSFTYGEPGQDPISPIASSMEELIQRTCEGLNAAEVQAAERKLANATEFDVDPELLELYGRVAPARKVAFAQAICERRMSVQEAAASLKVNTDEAWDWVRELLRRGVVRIRGVFGG
ncbi:MAG TPA: response regulator [Myxococcaceae bacterium]